MIYNAMSDVAKQQIKDALDGEAILTSLGVGKMVFSGVDIRCACPIHKGHGLNFAWHGQSNTFTCFSHHCGEDRGVPRDVFLLTQMVKGISFSEALRELAGVVGVRVDGDVQFDKEIYDVYEVKKWLRHKQKFGATENTLLDEEILESFQKKTHPYLATRNFPCATIQEFEIGYTDKFDLERLDLHGQRDFPGRVIVPIRDAEGGLVGFSGRLATDDEGLIEKYNKYRNMLDFQKGSILYGLHRAKKFISHSDYPAPRSLVLVEGFFDVIRAASYGLGNICASLGTSLLPAQVELIVKHANTVVLAYDSDSAGQKAAKRVHNQLKPFCDVYRLIIPAKDIGELSFDRFWEVVVSPQKL